MKENKKIYIIALAALGGGLSGGDRIFIEFARHWSKEVKVNVYVWEQGYSMCQRENLSGKNLKISVIKVGNFAKLGFVFTYFYRIILGIKLGLTLKVEDQDLVYSASEFWMDCLPAFILKIKNPKIVWVAAWYQTAPNPLIGFTEGKRGNTYRIRAFLYWFIQKTVKPLIFKSADFILVNNDEEKKQFLKQDQKGKVITVLGAVKTNEVIKYQKTHPPPQNKKYLSVFQGRFHPQKGVVELIDIWKKVTDKMPGAELAMIGDGPLMKNVKLKIKNEKLERNIKLFGYLHDGDKKYSIFNTSYIVLHPSFYDSGGMAAAEGMVFGLPCVAFNLKSYKFYYPKGMIKVSLGNNQAFADAIINLIYDKDLYKQTAMEGLEMVNRKWSWDERSNEIFEKILPRP